MAKSNYSFTNGELEIMKVVWDKDKTTVAEVTEVLSKIRPRRYVTILTMMRRMEEKGFLTHKIDGRTYVYSPTLSEKKARAGILKKLTKELFNGSKELLLVSLFDSEKIGTKEISMIKELITDK